MLYYSQGFNYVYFGEFGGVESMNIELMGTKIMNKVLKQRRGRKAGRV